MRVGPIMLALVLGGTVAALPRIDAKDAVRHRGEHVALAGQVSAVEARPDGAVLMIGVDTPVPVRVPASVRTQLGQKLGELRGRDVELTGTLTPAGQPLELVLDRPEHQLTESGSGAEDLQSLRGRVRELESELARLKAAQPQDLQSQVYGPLGPTRVYGASGSSRAVDVPLYAPLTKVLAERGVPTRTGWGPNGPILFYGRERWLFDDKSQLIDIRRD